jgi:hypothetical protein
VDRLLEAIPRILKFGVRRLDAILTILVVLKSNLAKLERLFVNYRVPLRKLLERKGAVSKDLPRNVTSRLNLEAHTDHFEWRPVFILDEVPHEFL